MGLLGQIFMVVSLVVGATILSFFGIIYAVGAILYALEWIADKIESRR